MFPSLTEKKVARAKERHDEGLPAPGVFSPPKSHPGGFFQKGKEMMEKKSNNLNFYKKLDSFVKELIAGGIQKKAPVKNKVPCRGKGRNHGKI
jgi:hypothetical protein